MLKLFKTTTALFPFIFILLLLIGFRSTVLYHGYLENNWQGNLAPFSLALKNNFGNLLINGALFNLTVSAIIVFFQSTILLSILNTFKIEEFKGFVAAWLYVLLIHIFPAFVFLSPELIAITFILLAFRSIVLTEESKNRTKSIFTSGLFIGVAATFWIPSTFFILVGVFSLLRIKNPNLKEVLLLIIGFFVPMVYVFAYLYITEVSFSVLSGFKVNQFKFVFYEHRQLFSYYVLLVVILFSLHKVFLFLNKLLKQEKLFFQLVFTHILFFIVLFFFQNDNNVNLFIPLILPTAIFLSIYFNRIKRKFVAESIHLILFLTIVVNFINFLK